MGQSTQTTAAVGVHPTVTASAPHRPGTTATAQSPQRATPTGQSTSNPTPTATVPHSTPTPSVTPGPFQVQAVNISVTPASVSGYACGTVITLTYIATFTISAGSNGGTVQFTYTTDGGQTNQPAGIPFSPGQTTGNYTFTARGSLSKTSSFPGIGDVTTTSPNVIQAAGVKPVGQCFFP